MKTKEIRSLATEFATLHQQNAFGEETDIATALALYIANKENLPQQLRPALLAHILMYEALSIEDAIREATEFARAITPSLTDKVSEVMNKRQLI